MIRVDMRLGGLISFPDGEKIALRRSFALLDGIGRERSVRGAADRMGVSYRSAWGQVDALQKAVGDGPLVVKTKGHGSVLTEQGAALRDAFGAALGEFEAPLAQAGQRLARTLSSLFAADARPRRLLLAMSHDPLLLDAIGATVEAGLIEASVVGSAEAASKLRAGSVDVAGLHSGEDGSRLPGTSARDGSLAGQGFRVEPLLRREQGLLLAPGNPLGITSVADLAVCRARFVNRQKGSGTRLWFDRLLAEAGLRPNAILGYEVEEFTHQAVAAVVASGAADAGFGLRAVAERFGLVFVSVGWETYYLAGRDALFGLDPVRSLSKTVQARTAGMPGYALP